MGGERYGKDSGEVPPSLPQFGYFFYDSLETVMKGRPGGKKELFVQRTGFFFLDSACRRNSMLAESSPK